jgi:RNA polymerase sigma-70 factor (ECF subfamily)
MRLMGDMESANTSFNQMTNDLANFSIANEQAYSLMQSIGQGNESAFEQLYDEYSPILYAICIRVLRHEFEAREVLSEVFVEVWKKASRYDPQRGTVRAFLVTLTRCRAIDYLRCKGGRTTNFDKLHNVWNATPESRKAIVEPHQSVLLREQESLLRDAVDALNETQKKVLTLAYFEGLSQSEIAQFMQLPLGTVKTAMRRGLASLRASLETSMAGDIDP